VNTVSAVPDEGIVADYPEKFGGSRNHLDDASTDYDKPPYSDYNPAPATERSDFLRSEPDFLRNGAPYSSGSELASSVGKPKKRRAGRSRDDLDGYASSGDELDDTDFDREYPPIPSEQQRVAYKQEFDRDHQEYKELQAELDVLNKNLAEVDRELDDLQEGSPQFLDALDEYNKLKKIKKSADYQVKKRRCKYLKGKLSHIKKMVADYDRRA